MRVMRRYLTDDEEQRFFRVVKRCAGTDTASQRVALRDYHLFKLLRHTAIRVGAATHITCGDARDALASGYLQRRGDKGGRDGKSLCNSRARRALSSLLRVRRLLGFNESRDGLLLVGLRRNQVPAMTVRAVQRRMDYWREAAGITEKVSPHWWRHTKAMRVMQHSTAQDKRAVVQELLDHQNYETTVIYTRPSREEVVLINEEVG